MRSTSTRVVISVAMIVAAVVLLAFFRDTRIIWILQGQPLGIVLGVIGVLDLLDAARRTPDQR